MNPPTNPWQRVILESPYAGEVEKNRVFALACSRDMFNRGEAPFASHLLYPRFLHRYNWEERRMGIEAGQIWIPVAHKMVYYTDLGISSGMRMGFEAAQRAGIPIEERTLGWQRV